MESNKITCPDAADLFDPSLDGTLTDAEQKRLEAHLNICDACSRAMSLATRARKSLRALPEKQCPDRVIENVFKKTIYATGAENNIPNMPGVQNGTKIATTRAFLLAASIVFCVLLVDAVRYENGKNTAPDITRSELFEAERDLKWTLAYLGDLTRRTGLKVNSDVMKPHLVAPINRAIGDIMPKTHIVERNNNEN